MILDFSGIVPAWTWLLVIQPFGICLGVVVLYYVARRK